MDETSVQRHCDAMMNAEIIAVDTETTGIAGIKDGRDYCMGISVAYRLGPLGIVSAYFPFRHQDGNLDRSALDVLRPVLESKPLVFHNVKFDLFSLETLGIKPAGKLYCTMQIAAMVNEELYSKELDAVGKKYVGRGKSKSEALDGWIKSFGWHTVPPGLMDEYACRDAELTLELFEVLWPKLREDEMHTLWPTERRFARLLKDVEGRGVRVNQEFADLMARKGRDRMGAILDELEVDNDTLGPKALTYLLFDVLGLPVVKWTQLDKEGNKTEKSKPCFDKSAMEQYDEILDARIELGVLDEGARNIAQLILEYRGWQKAVTSLYEPLLVKVSPDGRVRPNFKQHGTKTSRLSCSEPNLQQIPRKSEKPWNGSAKQAFGAADGYTLWGYDYSQLEFRLAAAYGQEQWLIEEFAKEGSDVFTVMAERIGLLRQIIKTFTYLTLYGGGLPRAAAATGKTEAEIAGDYEAFKESISGIRHVSQVAALRAKQRGAVKYWTGRKRHFPYADGHHKAFNSLLQGGAAELVKRAMIRLDDEVCDENCRIVLQVHDEIVFEIKDGMQPHYDPFIRKIMTDFPEFGVHFAVEGKVWNA